MKKVFVNSPLRLQDLNQVIYLPAVEAYLLIGCLLGDWKNRFT